MALREVLASFGVEIDDKALKDFDNSLGGVLEHVNKVAAGIAGAFAVKELVEFTRGVIETGAALVDTADRLGVGTQELQAFQYAGSLAGISAEEMTGALNHLNKSMGEAAMGNKEANQAFAAAGVQIRDATGQMRPAGDVLEDLGDSLDGMSSQGEKTAFLMKVLGRGGAALGPLFKDGSKGVRAALDEFEALGGGMSEDFVQAADEVDDEMTRVHLVFTKVSTQIVASLLPAVRWVTDATKTLGQKLQWLGENTNAVETVFIALGVAAAVLARESIAALVATLLEFAPIILLVGGLYLIFDDLFTLVTGGDSAIGQLLDTLFGVGTAEKVVTALGDAWAWVKENLGDGPIWIQSIKDVAGVVWIAVKAVVALGAALVGAGKALFHIVTGDWGKIGKDIDTAGDQIFGKNGHGGLFGDDKPNTGTPLASTAAWAGKADASLGMGGPEGGFFKPTPKLPGNGHVPWAAGGPGSPGAQMKQEFVTTINVHGGQTNEDTGRVVATAARSAHEDEKRQAMAALSSYGVSLP
jgi:hypothetical protein